MATHLRVGIDIGSSRIKAVIAEELNGVPKIIGSGMSEARGVHHGYITDIREAAESIRVALDAAEKVSKIQVKRAFVSVGGIGLGGITSTGSVVISRADLEVGAKEMKDALEAAEEAIPQNLTVNKRIINTIPVEWKIDGKAVWGRVEGLHAQKLEVKALFITCLEHHLEDHIRAVELAGVEVIDVVASPIAASFVTLSKKQKKAGCLLADLGSDTLSMIVFENGTPISIEVFPIGSTDITNDIALGLKLPLEEAEAIKLGSITRSSFSKKKLDEIISARLSDYFELIDNHLKKIGRNALLPAGVVITGGGAGLAQVRDLAEAELKLPASTAVIHYGGEERPNTKESMWAVAYGLTVVGFNAEDEQRSVGTRSSALIKEKGRRGIRVVSDWISQFLP